MRIALSGAHSTGKTTVLEAMRKVYPSFYYPAEAARDCPYPLNEGTSFKAQDFIFRTQVLREMAIPLNEVVITDRSTYDQLAYLTYAYDHVNITHKEYEILKKHTLAWGGTYDFIFYIPIEFPLVKDGVRSESEEYRREIDEMVRTILETYVDGDCIMTLSGSITERVSKLRSKLFELVEAELI